jgi:hypothetical protein
MENVKKWELGRETTGNLNFSFVSSYYEEAIY